MIVAVAMTSHYRCYIGERFCNCSCWLVEPSCHSCRTLAPAVAFRLLPAAAFLLARLPPVLPQAVYPFPLLLHPNDPQNAFAYSLCYNVSKMYGGAFSEPFTSRGRETSHGLLPEEDSGALAARSHENPQARARRFEVSGEVSACSVEKACRVGSIRRENQLSAPACLPMHGCCYYF